MQYTIEEILQEIKPVFCSSTCSRKEFTSDSEAIEYATKMAEITKHSHRVYKAVEEYPHNRLIKIIQVKRD